MDHLTSGCPILENNEYLMRNDKVCTHLHYSIRTALFTEMTDKWHRHTHPGQCMNRKILQRPGSQQYTQYTDREVTANRPDIATTNKKVKTCILIDVAIHVARICNAKGSEKGAKNTRVYV